MSRLYVLPLTIALVPAFVTHLALWISIQSSHVPACVPYWDGCTSISRAARYGLANQLFQWVMLPCALLHLANWWQTRRWLSRLEAAPGGGLALWCCGAIAAIALAIYVAALGSEGDFYRWMRRFGITFYFAGSYLAQLLFLRGLWRAGQGWHWDVRCMLGIASLLLAMGLATVAMREMIEQPDLKDRVENVLEWNLGLLMTLWFLCQAAVFKRSNHQAPMRP